jgi:DNA-binding CsgD family transcriptional regulator
MQKLFTQAMMNRENQLSGREIEKVSFLCKGLTHKEIGEQLFISPRTVEAHRNNIIAKLNFENIAEFVAFAVKTAWSNTTTSTSAFLSHVLIGYSMSADFLIYIKHHIAYMFIGG